MALTSRPGSAPAYQSAPRDALEVAYEDVAGDAHGLEQAFETAILGDQRDACTDGVRRLLEALISVELNAAGGFDGRRIGERQEQLPLPLPLQAADAEDFRRAPGQRS